MKGPACLFAIALLVGLTGMAHAFNIQFLDTAPAASFSEQDWEVASNTADDALNNAADGESRSWKNDEAGNGGTYTAQPAPPRDDRVCRTLQIEHYSRKAKATSAVVFCHQPDGRWMVEQ